MEHSYHSLQIENPDNEIEIEETREEITKENDELLIDAVKCYPHLYNPVLKEYKDIQMKENSWKEIASAMNMSIESCQTRWLRLRERFTKEQRLQEIETRSGSGANHHSIFYLYNNMLFLKNHIKRRRSYTNVNVPKKKISSTSNFSVNNFSPMNISSPLHSTNTHNNILESNQSSCHRDSNTSMEQTNRNISCITQEIDRRQLRQIQIDRTLNSNRFQDEHSEASHTRIPQMNNIYDEMQSMNNCISQEIDNETRSDILSQPPRNESRNSQTCSEISNDSISSRTMQSNFRKSNSGRIKNKNSTYLESSLAALSDTLQNRISKQSSYLPEQNAWNLNTLTPEKSFGLLVATELERIPEPERTKRKQAIIDILWKSIE